MKSVNPLFLVTIITFSALFLFSESRIAHDFSLSLAPLNSSSATLFPSPSASPPTSSLNTTTTTVFTVSAVSTSLLAPFRPPAAQPLLRDTKPLHCVNVWNIFDDVYCFSSFGVLLIPEYWLHLSYKIPDNRTYANYDKIICAPRPYNHDKPKWSICMFLEGVHDVGHWVEDWQGNRRVWREPGRVSGRQIKELVWHLAYWCCRSRCGDCLVNEVEGGEVREEPEFGGKVIGDSRTGWLKIDGVHDMGTCGGFCSIEDSAS